jgi:signal transduction histidine kinase
MPLPTLSAIGILANQISLTIGLALLMLILWQSRQRTNLLFVLFLAAVSAQAFMAMTYRLSAVLFYDPRPWLYGLSSAVGAYGVLMFIFTAEFTGKTTRLTRVGYLVGGLLWLLAVFLIWTDRLMVDVAVTPIGETVFRFTPAAYPILGVLIAFEALALANLVINPTPRSRALVPGVILLIIAAVLDTLPAIARLPVNSTLTAAAAILMARVILEFQLFNPLARLNEELAAANTELAKANLLKSQFMANMSHELRTPLNSIIGYTELVMKGLYGPISDQQTDRLERVLRNGRNLLTLINEVLDLSKIEAGRIELAMAEINLRQLIESAATAVLPQAQQKNLYLKTSLPDDLPPLRGDAVRLNQILVNLLGNAVKFTREGGITIDTHIDVTARRLHINVRDTGIGIAEEHLEDIFEEFHQVDSTSTREHGGTGLGLAISRRLARLHGGDISVSSDLGEGSVFTVLLPIEETSAP